MNCYNPSTRETYYISMIQPEQCFLSHDNDDAYSTDGCVYDVEYPACVVTCDNQIYLAGGNASAQYQFADDYSDDSLTEHTVMKHLFLYDNDHDTWVRKAPMLFPKSNFALVAVGSKIFCFGGMTYYHHHSEMIECYDCVTNRWTYVGIMPTTLVDLCALNYDEDIFILGGRSGVSVQNTVMKYNVTSTNWTTLATIPTARFKFGSCIIGDEIYVAGGQVYSQTNNTITKHSLRSVEIYNILRNQWRTGPHLPEPMCDVGLMLLNGCIYACGTSQRSVYNVRQPIIVCCLDLEKQKWTLVESDLCSVQAYVCVTADMYTRKLSQVFRPDVDT